MAGVIMKMFNCPKCSKRIPISNIKNKFTCPHCRASLKSNFVLVLILLIAAWSLTVPFIAAYVAPGMCGANSTCYGLVEAAIGIIIFFPIVPFILKVKLEEEE